MGHRYQRVIVYILKNIGYQMKRSVKRVRDRQRQWQTTKNTDRATGISYLTRGLCQPEGSKQQWDRQEMLRHITVLSPESSRTLWKALWNEPHKLPKQCGEAAELVLTLVGYVLVVTGLLALIVPLVALLVSWAFLMQYVKQ